MRKKIILLGFTLCIFTLSAQTTTTDSLTPQQEYFQEWLDRENTSNNVTMEYSVTGGATLAYGVNMEDNYSSFSHGFETTIDSSLDISFIFTPDSFTNSQYGFSRRGIYTEVILSDFGVLISEDAGVDFWESYTIYDDDGNIYIPTQDEDYDIVSNDADEDDEDYEYESTFFATGIQVTEPTVVANIHLTPLTYIQLSSKPELDYNYSTTLGSQGGWAGVGTETTGGLSFVFDSSQLFLSASLVSQYEMNYEDDDDDTFVQDDEFGASVEMTYDFSDNFQLGLYGTVINFFEEDEDDFYFLTDFDGSTVGLVTSSGIDLSYSLFEIYSFGFSGDLAYVADGKINRGDYDEDDTTVEEDLRDVSGFLYDARIDLPLYQTRTGGVAFSIGTYGYTFADQIYTSDEQNSDFPLDVQVSAIFIEDRWQLTGSLLASNILNTHAEYEDWLRDDFQALVGSIGGSYTLGELASFSLTPGFSLTFSTGTISSTGTSWTDDYESSSETSVSDWKDDVLGVEAYLEISFPQTLVTLKYESVQLLSGQENSQSGDEYTSFDNGIVTITTVVSF